MNNTLRQKRNSRNLVSEQIYKSAYKSLNQSEPLTLKDNILYTQSLFTGQVFIDYLDMLKETRLYRHRGKRLINELMNYMETELSHKLPEHFEKQNEESFRLLSAITEFTENVPKVNPQLFKVLVTVTEGLANDSIENIDIIYKDENKDNQRFDLKV